MIIWSPIYIRIQTQTIRNDFRSNSRENPNDFERFDDFVRSMFSFHFVQLFPPFAIKIDKIWYHILYKFSFVLKAQFKWPYSIIRPVLRSLDVNKESRDGHATMTNWVAGRGGRWRGGGGKGGGGGGGVEKGRGGRVKSSKNWWRVQARLWRRKLWRNPKNAMGFRDKNRGGEW